MALKRKRSCSSFSSPLSNTSSTVRDPSQNPTPPSPFPPTIHNQTSISSIHSIDNTPSAWGLDYKEHHTSHHLDSRTKKRFRDNRPSQDIIYQHTLQKLYSAPKHLSPTPSSHPHPSPPPIVEKPAPPQSSLHAFWSLPNQVSISRPSPSATITTALVSLQTTCDDCDRPLVPSNEADAMVLDDISDADLSCRVCGKRVCETCAVVADGRTCLECATSEKRSVGGIGWT